MQATDSKTKYYAFASSNSAFKIFEAKTRNLSISVRSSRQPNPTLVFTAGLKLLKIKKNIDSQEQNSGENNIDGDKMLVMNRYQLVQIIGCGTFSDLWSAEDKYRNLARATEQTPVYKKVAIKMMQPQFGDYGKQEALRLYQLNSFDRDDLNGIVKIYNTFYHQDRFCLVLELLEDSLEKLIQSHYIFTLSDIREIGHQILNAIDFLHKNNYIHADLKPDNIVLTNESGGQRRKVKLIDFGNAFKTDEIYIYSYDNNYELQSLQYRAPEVLLGLQIQNRMDLWSLGCIFAEMISGKLLFDVSSIGSPQFNDNNPPMNHEQSCRSGTSPQDIRRMLQAFVDVLGPLPLPLYASAFYYRHFSDEKCLFNFSTCKTANSLTLPPQRPTNGERLVPCDNSVLNAHLRYMIAQNKLRQRLRVGHSEEAQHFLDLLLCLLEYDPSMRFTAEEAMSHPFFAKVSDRARLACRGGLFAYCTMRNRICGLHTQTTTPSQIKNTNPKLQTTPLCLVVSNSTSSSLRDEKFSQTANNATHTVPYDIRLDSNSMETVQNSQISYEFTDDSDDDYMVLSGYASTEDVISDVDNLQILTKITESSPNISVPKSPHISDDKIHIVHDDNNIDDNDNSDRPKKHKKKKNFNIRRGYLFFRIPETPRRKLRILSRMPRNKKIRRTFSATQSEGSDKISVNIPLKRKYRHSKKNEKRRDKKKLIHHVDVNCE